MSRAADALTARVAALADTPAYRNYRQVREHVLAMLDASPDAPSAYWREELGNIEYLLDASPLVVAELRRHCYHVTGVWPYRYRSNTDASRRRHLAKLDALRARGGADVFVPEPDLLGGFGYAADGGFVNIDTLKFTEAAVALRLAGVLDALRAAERPVVWEIGPGWGGFAYMLKRLVPRARFVLTDLPQLFLLSATYLMTAFPDATVDFGPDGDADFVFVPSSALADTRPPSVDLAVNMVSFQEMTAAQVSAYVDHAAEIGVDRFYSLNKKRSPYNRELDSVPDVLSERYELTKVDVLPVPYTQFLEERGSFARRALARARRRDVDYAHLIGSLRR